MRLCVSSSWMNVMVRVYSLGLLGFLPPFFPPFGLADASWAGMLSPSSSVNVMAITRGCGRDLAEINLDEWSCATVPLIPAFSQSAVASASWKIRLLTRFTETSGAILTSYS